MWQIPIDHTLHHICLYVRNILSVVTLKRYTGLVYYTMVRPITIRYSHVTLQLYDGLLLDTPPHTLSYTNPRSPL